MSLNCISNFNIICMFRRIIIVSKTKKSDYLRLHHLNTIIKLITNHYCPSFGSKLANHCLLKFDFTFYCEMNSQNVFVPADNIIFLYQSNSTTEYSNIIKKMFTVFKRMLLHLKLFHS